MLNIDPPATAGGTDLIQGRVHVGSEFVTGAIGVDEITLTHSELDTTVPTAASREHFDFCAGDAETNGPSPLFSHGAYYETLPCFLERAWLGSLIKS